MKPRTIDQVKADRRRCLAPSIAQKRTAELIAAADQRHQLNEMRDLAYRVVREKLSRRIVSDQVHGALIITSIENAEVGDPRCIVVKVSLNYKEHFPIRLNLLFENRLMAGKAKVLSIIVGAYATFDRLDDALLCADETWQKTDVTEMDF